MIIYKVRLPSVPASAHIKDASQPHPDCRGIWQKVRQGPGSAFLLGLLRRSDEAQQVS